MASNKDLDAHIPVSLRDPVLVLTRENAWVGNLPTVFVGIVDENYTEEMWISHVGRLGSLFNITDANVTQHIMIRNKGNNTIDALQLGKDMTSAIDKLNASGVEIIRIVGLGKSSAKGVFDALESLVHGWDIPPQNKIVQFVALGDSLKRDYLNLCKTFCMKKLCSKIQFYSTMDYNQFGFLELNKYDHGIEENIERFLSEMMGVNK